MKQKYRFTFEKLVRDKIPEIISAKNIDVFSYIMEQEEYIQSLKQKLLEEAEEVIAATSTQLLQKELADVLEVIYTLADAHKINITEIERIRLHKKESRGGFGNKRYITYIEMDQNNKDKEYYLKHPGKYHQIHL